MFVERDAPTAFARLRDVVRRATLGGVVSRDAHGTFAFSPQWARILREIDDAEVDQVDGIERLESRLNSTLPIDPSDHRVDLQLHEYAVALPPDDFSR